MQRQVRAVSCSYQHNVTNIERRGEGDPVNNLQRPRVALTLGDPAGVGPELIANLLARHDLLERVS